MGVELKELLAKYTLEEIIPALFDGVDDPVEFHMEMAQICSKVCADLIEALLEQASIEIAETAKKHNHYCPAILAGLLILSSEQLLTKKQICEIRDELLKHIREAED